MSKLGDGNSLRTDKGCVYNTFYNARNRRERRMSEFHVAIAEDNPQMLKLLTQYAEERKGLSGSGRGGQWI